MKLSVKTFSTLILLLLLGCSSQNRQDSLVVLDGSTMGTFYSLKIVREDLQTIPYIADTVKSKIDSVLQKVNQQMSTYLEDSEISRFNQYQGTDWFPVSADLAFVVKNALRVSRLSHGTFDITVGPLVNLWGFGPENRQTLIPSEQEILARKQLTGYQNLSVRMDSPALKKSLPGIYVDLSAIAKGFAVDRVAGRLIELGFDRFMIEIGGEVTDTPAPRVRPEDRVHVGEILVQIRMHGRRQDGADDDALPKDRDHGDDHQVVDHMIRLDVHNTCCRVGERRM